MNPDSYINEELGKIRPLLQQGCDCYRSKSKSPLPAKTLLIAAGCCSLAVLLVCLFVLLRMWSLVGCQCSGGWFYARACMGNYNGLLKKKRESG